MDIQEKRRAERLRMDFGVRLFHDGMLMDNDTRIVDLGPGGFALLSPAPIDLGESVGFRLRLRDGVEIQGAARVLWREPFGFARGYLHGASFVQLPFFARQHLLQYLDPGRMSPLNVLDLGLTVAASLVAVLVAKDFSTAHSWAENATWMAIAPCLALALLAWTFAAKIRSRS